MRDGRQFRRRRREILFSLLQSGILPLLRTPRWNEELPETQERLLHERRAELGRRLKKWLEQQGATYVKFGQMLSTRRDLLPEPVVQELEKLQDEVLSEPFSDVRATLEEEFGAPPETIFQSIDPQAIASASIAQAYRAQLRTGESVCVKVQRHNIAAQIRLDLRILKNTVARFGHFFRISRVIALDEVVQAFSEQMQAELDFRVEAQNLETFASLHRQDKYVRVPACYHAWTTQRIMTMEYIDAQPLKEAAVTATTEERAEIARRILYSYSNQVFRDGFFHGDPHPGNLFVEPEQHIVFVDFGIIGRLSKKNKYAILQLFLGITRDAPRIVLDALLQMGLLPGHADLRAFEQDLQSLLDKYLYRTLHEVQLSELTGEFLRVLYRYEIHVPGSLTSLAKTFVIMEGVVENLGIAQNILEIAEPIARKLLRNFISRDYLTEFLLPAMFDAYTLLREIPGVALDGMRKLRAAGYEPKVYLQESAMVRKNRRNNTHLVTLGLTLLANGILFAAFFLTWALSTRPSVLFWARLGAILSGFFEVFGAVLLLFRWRSSK
uniref:ABC1 kinase family protein n=1 Tax=Ndongobacter massiliensis TaxID=1871025 RepID=UPI0009309435|nr:AarF/UbiB family protein [Ndongobacter massiliensis]